MDIRITQITFYTEKMSLTKSEVEEIEFLERDFPGPLRIDADEFGFITLSFDKTASEQYINMVLEYIGEYLRDM